MNFYPSGENVDHQKNAHGANAVGKRAVEVAGNDNGDHQHSHSPDNFCYVCGEYISVSARKYPMIKATKVYLAYEACLKTEITNLNESWVPHYVCAVCYTELIGKV